MKICSLGDLMLDLIVRLEQPLAHGDDTRVVTRVSAGGQAANVAAWAAALGAQSILVAKRGGDIPGRLVAAEVSGRGVELLGPMEPGRNGVVVSLVETDGERSMLSDPGVAPELRAEELQTEWFQDCDALYISGYALLRSPIELAAARAAAAVHTQGGIVAVDLSTWRAIRDFGAERFLTCLQKLEPDVLFGSERELAELGPDSPAKTLVLKRAADGVVVIGGSGRSEHAALPVEAVDTTGAGDALAAGFLVGGIDLGLEAAARCVSKLGAMP